MSFVPVATDSGVDAQRHREVSGRLHNSYDSRADLIDTRERRFDHELVVEVPLARVDEVRAAIIRIMESAAELAVPLCVDSGVGSNWDEAH